MQMPLIMCLGPNEQKGLMASTISERAGPGVLVPVASLSSLVAFPQEIGRCCWTQKCAQYEPGSQPPDSHITWAELLNVCS